jgi:hypothetical protein
VFICVHLWLFTLLAAPDFPNPQFQPQQQPPKQMTKKNKTEKSAPQPGDTISTLRNGEKIYAVITGTEGALTARQCAGPEFKVDEKNIVVEQGS